GDQRAYFQTLAGARLYLPGLAAGSPGQLATWQRDGETYVLAFTSVEALEDCVEGEADAYLTADCADLLRDWPDPAWRLALEPVPGVEVDLVAVARHWPDPSYRLAVNPGSAIGIVLTGEEVGLLVPWAQDVVRRYLTPEPLLEKAIAPEDVDRYVRGGYDRVTG